MTCGEPVGIRDLPQRGVQSVIADYTYSSGSEITFQCADHMQEVVGNTVIMCIGDKWSGSVPVRCQQRQPVQPCMYRHKLSCEYLP